MLKDSIMKFLKLENLVENVTGFVETRIELMKYELKEDVARVVSKVVLYLAVALVFTFFLFFISLAIAIKLSGMWGDFWGFATVAFFYIAVGITLFLLRDGISLKLERQLRKTIQNKK